VEPDPALFQDNERTTPDHEGRQFASVGALKCAGGLLPEVTIAYETWGELNAARDNAVLVCHAVSGDSHAVGWWDRIVGPGRAIDTDHFFVICSNTLGGCQGSTGPAGIAPDGMLWASRFPMISVENMVEAQIRLIEHLGIPKLRAVIGGSMGGMQAIEWTLQRPGLVDLAILTASCASHSAMQIGFNEAARQAVLRDPKFRGGDYPLDDPPVDGLSIARMIGHLSYLSEASFDRKFGRRLQDKEHFDYSWSPEFQVESYLNYQGDKFTRRFDANSFLVLTRAIDYYSRTTFAGSKSRYLILSYKSDWLYPTHQSITMESMARDAGCRVERYEIDLPLGHDSFLLDGDKQGTYIRSALAGDLSCHHN